MRQLISKPFEAPTKPGSDVADEYAQGTKRGILYQPRRPEMYQHEADMSVSN
jgi:hypothetical protein